MVILNTWQDGKTRHVAGCLVRPDDNQGNIRMGYCDLKSTYCCNVIDSNLIQNVTL